MTSKDLTPAQAMSRSTYLSIGLVMLLVGVSFYAAQTVGDIEKTITEKVGILSARLSSIDSTLKAMKTDVAGLRLRHNNIDDRLMQVLEELADLRARVKILEKGR